MPEQPPIPRAVLFGNPQRTAPVISPDGTRLGFRSTRGYGRAFLSAGDKQWGWAMQDDLADAVDHLVGLDRITAAVLVAHGANDPRVRQAESEQIVAALRERGVPHEYLLVPDEGHGLARPENREAFYARAETFLARHLGGRAQP